MQDQPWLLDDTVENIDGVATEDHKVAMRYRTEITHKRTWVVVCLIHFLNTYNRNRGISLRVLKFLTLADLGQLPFPTHSVLKVFTFFQSNMSFIPSLIQKVRMSEWRDSVFKRFSYPILNSMAFLFLPCSCLAMLPPPPHHWDKSDCLASHHP